ncbi:ABC transporter substrate-binding protein [Microtetraspora niveoalba]|uniref:ABC transporter substrate-binding protein n=1 Tax=Microtetraspora niveoalba TaxID=46175 RepID=UPI00147259FB|nr:ABC transporter substrate-binding protein [Microtetraspora niveoalba]
MVALGLTACASGGSSERTAADGRKVAIGLAGEPGNLDPTLSNSLSSSALYPAFCQMLYNEMREGTVPVLATKDPEFSKDMKSARVTLREDAKFADGTPVNAEAVRFSLERHKTLPGSQRVNELDAVKDVTVVDDHTVELTFNYPIAPGVLKSNLASRGGTIMSPTAVKKLGDEGFAAAPVCSGPFKFAGRVAQDNVTLVKDPNYFDAANVHLDKVVYRVIPDSAVRIANLRSGDLDIIDRVSPTDVPTIEASDRLKIETFPSLGHVNLIFNIGNSDGAAKPAKLLDDPIAKNADVRRALELAIDRDAINKVVFGGKYETACGFMAPTSEFSTKESQSCPGYDPAAAKELLKSTGVGLPFHIEILMNQMPEYRRVGEMIQQMAKEAGFEVTLNIQESTTSAEATQQGKFQVYLNSFTGSADPDMNVARFYESDTPTNVGKFVADGLDDLLTEARSEADTGKRTKLYDQIHKIITDATASIYLVRPTNIIAYNGKLTGLTYRATGGVVPTGIDIAAK